MQTVIVRFHEARPVVHASRPLARTCVRRSTTGCIVRRPPSQGQQKRKSLYGGSRERMAATYARGGRPASCGMRMPVLDGKCWMSRSDLCWGVACGIQTPCQSSCACPHHCLDRQASLQRPQHRGLALSKSAQKHCTLITAQMQKGSLLFEPSCCDDLNASTRHIVVAAATCKIKDMGAGTYVFHSLQEARVVCECEKPAGHDYVVGAFACEWIANDEQHPRIAPKQGRAVRQQSLCVSRIRQGSKVLRQHDHGRHPSGSLMEYAT